MKKGLPIILAVITLTFVAYYKFDTKKVNFIALGDGIALGENSSGKISVSFNDYLKEELAQKRQVKFYTKDFCKKDMRIKDLRNQIDTNYQIKYKNKKISINQAIHNANLITLSIGATDLFYSLKINNTYLKANDEEYIYKQVDILFEDLEKLIKQIRKDYDKKLIVIGFYNPLTNQNYINNEIYDEVFSYCDDLYYKLSYKYNFTYIKTNNLIRKNKKYLPNSNSIHLNRQGYKQIANEIINVVNFDKI